MAGTTTSFPFKPLLSRTLTPPLTFTLSSLESSINGVRLWNLNFLKIDSTRSIHVTSINSITARFGGYRPKPSSSRRSRDVREEEHDDDDDASLDVSRIRSATVRLIDAEQNMIGIVSKSEAIQLADEAELDLVILSPDADPPVLRIMDYSKYKYEQQKKKREQMKRSAATRMDTKELKMGYNIDIHDYSVRLKAALKFLKEGDKVKMNINLKGREKVFRNTAIELMQRFQNDVGELATVEAKSFKDRNIFVVLVPNKAILTKALEQQKKKEKSDVTETSTEISADTSTDTLTDVSAESDISVEASAESDISVEASAESDISVEDSAESDISVEASAESDISPETSAESDISVEDSAESDISVEASAESDISPETSAESDISVEDSADISVEASAESDISVEASAECDISAETSAESDISVEASAESDISVEASAESDISVEASAESDISPETSAESDISAETSAESHISAETSTEISAGV